MSIFEGARDGARAEGTIAKEELLKDSSKVVKSSESRTDGLEDLNMRLNENDKEFRVI